MQTPAERIKVDAGDLDGNSIRRAAELIGSGGLVVYPTETFYALGADALDGAAVNRVFGLKGRSAGKPLAVIVDGRELLASLTAGIPHWAEKLMERFWPGPLTLIFKASSAIPPSLTAGTGKVGVRVPSSEVARALAAAARRPITATSANLSGGGGVTREEELSHALRAGVDLILDGGTTPGGPESTILDITILPPILVRAGAISREALEEVLKLHISGGG